jgi:hypothetical protein
MRRRELDGGRHRQIGVADDLQALQRFSHDRVRPPDCDPRQLHLWYADGLGQAAKAEREHLPAIHHAAGAGGRADSKLVVGKDLVGDDRDAARGA